jgi:hypothetical protein
VARLAIFETDSDYAAFVKVLRQTVERQDRLAIFESHADFAAFAYEGLRDKLLFGFRSGFRYVAARAEDESG